MESVLGNSLIVHIFVTWIVIGFAAFMTGQAVASKWKSAWQVVAYVLLLGLADRFIIFSIFGGELLTIAGYLVDTLALMAIALSAYRLTQVRCMVTQYPWLYSRAGLFRWHEIPALERKGDG